MRYNTLLTILIILYSIALHGQSDNTYRYVFPQTNLSVTIKDSLFHAIPNVQGLRHKDGEVALSLIEFTAEEEVIINLSEENVDEAVRTFKVK